MGILLAFAPFIAFAVVDRLIGLLEGLVVACIVSLTLILREFVTPNRSPKLLDIGTLILFGGLSV